MSIICKNDRKNYEFYFHKRRRGGRGNYSPEPIVFNLKLRYFSKT